MNKKMEQLYVELNTVFRMIDELKEEHAAHPEKEEPHSEMLTMLGNEIVKISERLDYARGEYQSQPLWKKLFRK